MKKLIETGNPAHLHSLRNFDFVKIPESSQLKEGWKIKKKQLLDDKIDVTLFLIWFIEHGPESKLIMQQDPDYQNRFK